MTARYAKTAFDVISWDNFRSSEEEKEESLRRKIGLLQSSARFPGSPKRFLKVAPNLLSAWELKWMALQIIRSLAYISPGKRKVSAREVYLTWNTHFSSNHQIARFLNLYVFASSEIGRQIYRKWPISIAKKLDICSPLKTRHLFKCPLSIWQACKSSNLIYFSRSRRSCVKVSTL